jgi:hypothetical protein
VTLANADVQKALDKDFVCSWSDATGDPEIGVSFAHSPKEKARPLDRGNGEHNVQILFLTPTREVFHAVVGYVEPKAFVQELALARKVYAATLAAGIHRGAVVARMQRIAAADARRRPDARTWNAHGDVVVLAREFVAKHPLLPASEYRPSLIFGPGGGQFFGVGKSRHGLLGTPATTPPPAAPPPEEAVAAFVRRAAEEWKLVRVASQP